ncbi:MAG: hypothetical protein ACE5H1_04150, partial [Thermodesulfobacteriota bacterium]
MDNNSVQNLDKILSKLEKRRNKNLIIKGVIEFFLFVFFIITIASLLSIIYSNIIFLAVIKIALIISICYGFWKLVLSIVIKRGKIHEISHELNKLSPGLGEDSINAVLLKKNLSKQDKEIGVSKILIRAHIYTVIKKLESIDLSDVFSLKRIQNYWKPLTIILILFLISINLAPSNFRNLLFSTKLLNSEQPHLLELA